LISRELHLIHNLKILLLAVDLLTATAKWQDVQSHVEENIYFDSEGKGLREHCINLAFHLCFKGKFSGGIH
jgi:hypothetical protein